MNHVMTTVTKDSHCMNMNVKIERKHLCVNLVSLAMSHNTQVAHSWGDSHGGYSKRIFMMSMMIKACHLFDMITRKHPCTFGANESGTFTQSEEKCWAPIFHEQPCIFPIPQQICLPQVWTLQSKKCEHIVANSWQLGMEHPHHGH